MEEYDEFFGGPLAQKLTPIVLKALIFSLLILLGVLLWHEEMAHPSQWEKWHLVFWS